MKNIIFSVLLLIPYYLSSSVTHNWPSSGVNDTTVVVHIFGDGFNGGVSGVSLYKSGNPVINGFNISVVNDNYLTCQFDLTGVSTTTYNLIINTDTLDMCFTVNERFTEPCFWFKTSLGSCGGYLYDVAVGDGNNDGIMEVYAACYDNHIYQFKWNGANWEKTDLGSGGSWMFGVTVGDGNNDGDLEVYGSCHDYHVYQFHWNGAGWDKTDLGSGGSYMTGVTVGDGNNDGDLEVYAPCCDNHVYQFHWNGSSWDKTDLGSGSSDMAGVAVGDGNNDEIIEVYAACNDNHIYQFKWNGTGWDMTDLGFGGMLMNKVSVGDGNKDGVLEVYGACEDNHIYQFSWNGADWDKTDLGSGGSYMRGVSVGDGNNDGVLEVYASNFNNHIYQFKWNGADWDKTDLGSGGSIMYGIVVGDGNNDGILEVYGANRDYYIYQFRATLYQHIALSDTSHNFYTIPGDSAIWEYLFIKNTGEVNLIVDSVSPSIPQYSVENITFPYIIFPGDSTGVAVKFKPDTEGIFTDTLTVYSDDPDDSLLYVYLQGMSDSTCPSVVNLISPADSSFTNNSSINFIWSSSTDSVSGIDYYRFQCAYDAGFTSVAKDTNVVDTTLSNIYLTDSVYYWREMATDKVGNESSWSDIWLFEVDTDNPAIPYLINPVGGNFYSNDTVDFSWTVVRFKDSESAPVRYIIEIDSINTFTTPISTDTIDNNTIEKILSENFYYWHVKVFDLAGNESQFSGADSFGIDMTTPVIESTTVWTDTSFSGPFTVNVNITDNSNIDTCLLFYKRGEDPDFNDIILTPTGGNWYSAEIPQVYLNPDTIKYYIYAKDISNPANVAFDPDGAPGNYYSFTVYQVGIAEITEIPAIFSFSYSYSRPDEIIFNLAVPEVSDISLKIFDITGREVSSLISGQLSPAFYNIRFNPLSKGTYFYRLESSYQSMSGKFIIVE